MKRLIFVLGILFIFICSGVLPAAAAQDKGDDGHRTRDVDRDHDGYSSDDCNDRDYRINPGVDEICDDGIDNNCDNLTDGQDTDACPAPVDPNTVDNDGDGYTEYLGDCDDSDAGINPRAAETPYNGVDENCNGMADDNDLDGDGSLSPADCNDNNAGIFPGAVEIFDNGVDENCNGTGDDKSPIIDTDNDGVLDDVDKCANTPTGDTVNDLGCTIAVVEPSVDPPSYTDGHHDNPNCIECHDTEANQVHASVHYQWNGPATYMVGGKAEQGKANGAMNTYCGNIAGNWEGCAACHIGNGMQITEFPTEESLADINCLKCHSAPGQMPTRETCLKCHAKAGGGDALKRGDLALATGNTADRRYDVHMSTSGGNLACQDCHTTESHRIAGKGSDLRPTDLDVEVTCSNCHSERPHSNSTYNRHTAKVACQTCHIPVYGKNASDTAATEATEFFRSWKTSEASASPFHPYHEVANDLVPVYRFWNGTTKNYNVGDLPNFNSATGAYETSIPQGDSSDPDAKLYPFKYKTVEQPAIVGTHQLIPVNTKIFFATADADTAIRSGLENMGRLPDTPYEWAIADTYQMLNHQVSPKEDALTCQSCHVNKGPKLRELGYATAPNSSCSSCHDSEKSSKWRRGNYSDFISFHDKHVRDKGYNCNRCHSNR